MIRLLNLSNVSVKFLLSLVWIASKRETKSMVAILQHMTLVKYLIFGMALEVAERLFQCTCHCERERKKAKPRVFRRCETGCETASVFPCISVLGVSFKLHGGYLHAKGLTLL